MHLLVIEIVHEMQLKCSAIKIQYSKFQLAVLAKHSSILSIDEFDCFLSEI